VIAYNKLAGNAGWDRNLFGLEFQYYSSLDIDFDVSLTTGTINRRLISRDWSLPSAWFSGGSVNLRGRGCDRR
jgi:hypothetical protein